MVYYTRWLQKDFSHPASRGKVRLLFGARQTGKSTLLGQLVEGEHDRKTFDLQEVGLRLSLEKNPAAFSQELLSLKAKKTIVFVDEIQKVPALLDQVQFLYDRDPKRFSFILTGSSARRLHSASSNLLPGRCHLFHLFPVLQAERAGGGQILPLPPSRSARFFPDRSLENLLLFGSLPGVAAENPLSATRSLEAYAELYLEEEIRREGLVREVGAFSRFLELAALSSGKSLNLAKLSNESGVAKATLRNYYQVLVDTFVGHWLEPFTESARKRLLSTPKFYFFDLGVRHAAARLPADVRRLALEGGDLLEHWVGLELIHRSRYLGRSYRVGFWRTTGGAEVDFVLKTPRELIPVEVKWTDNPTLSDARHLVTFLEDYPLAHRAYIVCRVKEPRRLNENIEAIPWWMM